MLQPARHPVHRLAGVDLRHVRLVTVLQQLGVTTTPTDWPRPPHRKPTRKMGQTTRQPTLRPSPLEIRPPEIWPPTTNMLKMLASQTTSP